MSQIWQQHQHKLEERHKGEHHTRQQLFLLFRVKGYQSSDILVGDISFFVATDQWMNLYDTIHTSAIGGKGLAPITSINILKFIVSSSSLNSVFVVAHIVPDHISLVAVHPNMWKLMNISLICRWHTYYWKYQYSQCQITVISLHFVCVRRIASFQLNTTQLKKLVWSAVLSIQLECIRNWFCFGLFDFFGFGLYLLCFCCGFVLDFVAAFARLYSAHQIHIVRIYGHFILGL